MATTHSLSAGTDRATPLMRYGFLATIAAVVALTVVRLVRAERHDLMAGTAARTPTHPPEQRARPEPVPPVLEESR
jgi:hypothetical protein